MKEGPRVARSTSKRLTNLQVASGQSSLPDERLVTLKAIEQRHALALNHDDPSRQQRPPQVAKSRRSAGTRHRRRLSRRSSPRSISTFCERAIGFRSNRTPRRLYHAAQYLLGNLDQISDHAARIQGIAGLPEPHQGPGSGRFLDRFGRTRRGRAGLCRARRIATPQLHFGEVTSNRFISLIGDAELDEGNVWETVAEEAIRGLGNVIWIIDLNRQSLDRVIPGVRAGRLKALFAGAGWQRVRGQIRIAFCRRRWLHSPNDALRRRIDEMSNEEYQALIRIKDGAELRTRLTDVADADYRRDLIDTLIAEIADDDLRPWSAISAVTTCRRLIDVLEPGRRRDRCAFGDLRLHGQRIRLADGRRPPQPLAAPHPGRRWNRSARSLGDRRETISGHRFAPDSAEGKFCAEAAAQRLSANSRPLTTDSSPRLPGHLDARNPNVTSTQEALGRALARLADFEVPAHGSSPCLPTSPPRPISPAGSTRSASFRRKHAPISKRPAQQMLKWQPNPGGQHIELGISEMNLFMALASSASPMN